MATALYTTCWWAALPPAFSNQQSALCLWFQVRANAIRSRAALHVLLRFNCELVKLDQSPRRSAFQADPVVNGEVFQLLFGQAECPSKSSLRGKFPHFIQRAEWRVAIVVWTSRCQIQDICNNLFAPARFLPRGFRHCAKIGPPGFVSNVPAISSHPKSHPWQPSPHGILRRSSPQS